MVKRIIVKAVAHLRGYPPVLHTIEVEAEDESQAQLDARKYVTLYLQSFGRVTHKATVMTRSGIEGTVSVKRKPPQKVQYRTIDDEFGTMALAIEHAKEFALERKESTWVNQHVDAMVAEITYHPGRLPKWKVTYIEEK